MVFGNVVIERRSDYHVKAAHDLETFSCLDSLLFLVIVQPVRLHRLVVASNYDIAAGFEFNGDFASQLVCSEPGLAYSLFRSPDDRDLRIGQRASRIH